ncbi:MAG TPA: TonB-dependent receptor plug domain-containing protein, partial [Rhizomicrobium sp.]|nr:TonB-dependent receptor plug domain-containing protein [Rhizomicrobium sp.]
MAVINRCKLHSAAKLLAGASLAALSAGPAAGQTGRNEQVIVTGTRANSDITSLTKLPEPIIDTPQTVGVVGSEELTQRGTANLNDALRNLPGISLGAGEFSWQGNNPTIRGFLARNDMYLDGVRDFGSYYRD